MSKSNFFTETVYVNTPYGRQAIQILRGETFDIINNCWFSGKPTNQQLGFDKEPIRKDDFNMNDLEEKKYTQEEFDAHVMTQRFRMVELKDTSSACARYKNELEAISNHSENRAKDYDNAYNVLYELELPDNLKTSLVDISKEYNKYLTLEKLVEQEIALLDLQEDALNKEYDPRYDPDNDYDALKDHERDRKERQKIFLDFIQITLTRIVSRRSELIKTKTVLLTMGEHACLKESVNLIDKEIDGILYFINKLDEIKIRESTVNLK